MLRAGRHRVRPSVSLLAAVLAALLLGAPASAPAGSPRFEFAKGVVAGTNTDRVTTLQFGPDGRLYVGQQNGLIKVLTVVRHGPGSYEAVKSETIGDLVDLATHSGVLSRLTWDGSAWSRLDLVRGLPRSEENHAGNGLVLDPSGERLFL